MDSSLIEHDPLLELLDTQTHREVLVVLVINQTIPVSVEDLLATASTDDPVEIRETLRYFQRIGVAQPSMDGSLWELNEDNEIAQALADAHHHLHAKPV